jgi:hypothetical protein
MKFVEEFDYHCIKYLIRKALQRNSFNSINSAIRKSTAACINFSFVSGGIKFKNAYSEDYI